MRILRRQELEDIVHGGMVLGCGGGGDAKVSGALVEEIMAVSAELPMVSPDEVRDDAVLAVVSGMGSPVATKKKGFDPEQCVAAVEILEQVSGRKLTHVVAVETGGGNFLPPVYVAARKGLCFIDADGVGRAIPEMQMTMYHVMGIPPSPMVLSDRDGSSVVIYEKDALRCERIGRAIVTEMGGAAGCASYPMDGATMKSCIIPGTYTRAERVGAAVRKAREQGEDPVAAVVTALEGVEFIRGRLARLELKTVRAHDRGFAIIEGTGKHDGQTVKIAFKNENMVAWGSSPRPLVVSPDLPCIIGVDGTALTNADLEEGMEIAVIGAGCHPRWRTDEGIGVFREVLAELGYDGPYSPLAAE